MSSAFSRLRSRLSEAAFEVVLSRKPLVLAICCSTDFRFVKLWHWISALTTTGEKQTYVKLDAVLITLNIDIE